MKPSEDRTESIFNAARERTSSEEQSAFLDKACGADEQLRARVQDLLQSDREAGSFLSMDPTSKEAPGVALAERAGHVIGRYQLVEEIGEGGFGTVFIADQLEPVRRRVALKIIKLGMDTRDVIARFETERQALALMDHPNIAKVLDAGATQTGRPYFVMDLVRGQTITRFCEEHKLVTKDRLKLFLDVCVAVQHAHQKGIIHRDLKPSNILVSSGDDPDQPPLPKVIDFGIAKAIPSISGLPNQARTQVPIFMGTPAYMSPEQADAGSGDVDTRSDIYSLGVILYELLTGQTPLESGTPSSSRYEEICRRIREEEPATPSARLRSMNRGRKSKSDNQHFQPSVDLDWVVMKALAKERENRYQSAGALAEDIRRYLGHEPVLAAAPSVFYTMRKFVRRNRGKVASGLTIAAVFLGGGLLSTWQAIQTNKAHDAAEATLKFLEEDLLAQTNPNLSRAGWTPNRNLKLLEAIALASQGLEKRYPDQPQVEAAIRLTIGKALRALGELDVAEHHLRRVLAIYDAQAVSDHAKMLEARLALAWVHFDRSEYQKAEALSTELLQVQRRRFGIDSTEALQTTLCLAWASLLQSKNSRSQELFERVLQTARGSPQPNDRLVINAMQGLGFVVLEQQGHSEEWVGLAREVFSRARQTLGTNHPNTLSAAVPVISALHNQLSRSREADQLARDTYQRCLRILGEEHPTTLANLSELAQLAWRRGIEFLPLQSNVVALSERVLGEDHEVTLFHQVSLGEKQASFGNLSAGEILLTNAMQRQHRLRGTDTMGSRWVMECLSGAYIYQGRFDEVEPLRFRIVEADRRILAPEAPALHNSLRALGNVYARQGKWRDASQLFQQCLTHPSGEGRDLAHGLLVSWLANDRVATERIIALILDRTIEREHVGQAQEIALALLLVFEGVPDAARAKVFSRVDRTLSRSTGSLQDNLLLGLAAKCQGEWVTASERLAPLADNPDAAVAALAGFSLAQALHQEGRIEQAQSALALANNRLEQLLRIGDLGNTGPYPKEEWVPAAAAMIAWREAEQGMHQRSFSPASDVANLRANRAKWRPVRDLLARAGWLARRRDWDQAAQVMVRALEHDAFTWDAAQSEDPALFSKVAGLMALTGDQARYEALCRRFLYRAHSSQSDYAELAAYSPAFPSSELREKAEAIARWASQASETAEQNEARFHARQVILGILHYRNQDYQKALETLNRALEAYNLKVSGSAHAFAAMAAWHSGQPEMARSLLAQAEGRFQELTDGTPNDLGHDWAGAVMAQIALKEARNLLDVMREPGSSQDLKALP